MGDGVEQTATFFLLTAATTIIVSGWALSNRSARLSERTARAFYFLAIALSVAALLLILAGVLGVHEGPAYVHVLRVLLFRGWIVIGVGISAAALLVICVVTKTGGESLRAFIASPYVLKGLCISVAISFFCTEIGKAAHDADMRQFFLQSGYSVAFMYFIMAAETAGAVGLLIPRTTLPAAIGLMAVMAGAIRTHAHNRDPFSDSLEAVHLLILLACVVVLRVVSPKAIVEIPTSRKGRDVRHPASKISSYLRG